MEPTHSGSIAAGLRSESAWRWNGCDNLINTQRLAEVDSFGGAKPPRNRSGHSGHHANADSLLVGPAVEIVGETRGFGGLPCIAAGEISPFTPSICKCPEFKLGTLTLHLAILFDLYSESEQTLFTLPVSRAKMEFADRDLTCSGCGAAFVFSAGEQKFFEDKGFKNDPKRCKSCRTESHGKKVRGVETCVTCAKCGAATTVPFIPRRNRPVLCRACFGNQAKVPNTLTALADDGIKAEKQG